MQQLQDFQLSKEKLQALDSFAHLLLRWNEKIQLTATRDLDEFIERHVVDALHLAKLLPNSPARMLDVGSGGGLPGLVLAIVHPQIDFTLIEPIKKKCAFLSSARRELALKNVRNLAIRDTELKQRDDFEPYDFAVARAVWSTEEWLARGPSLVRDGGALFALEGREKFSLEEGCERFEYALAKERSRSIIRKGISHP